MKRVTEACVGNRNFSLDEDAFKRLEEYLMHFRSRISGTTNVQNDEIMSELEERIAELFLAETGNGARVVSLALVEKVIAQLGMPDGNAEQFDSYANSASDGGKTIKRIYRDVDNKAIAGVCSGLAVYLDIDIVFVRVLMLVALFAGSVGFWIYIIFWIVVPKAVTPVQKCEMHGIPATAENMSRFSRTR